MDNRLYAVEEERLTMRLQLRDFVHPYCVYRYTSAESLPRTAQNSQKEACILCSFLHGGYPGVCGGYDGVVP